MSLIAASLILDELKVNGEKKIFCLKKQQHLTKCIIVFSGMLLCFDSRATIVYHRFLSSSSATLSILHNGLLNTV